MEKKLDGNYTRMLRAILNKFWSPPPRKQQLYSHLPPITKTIQVRQSRYAGHCWRSGDDSWEPLHMDEQKQVDQLEPTYSSSVVIQDVALKTYRQQWTIVKGGGRGSGRSALAVWHNDDDGSWHHQTSWDERKNFKSVSQENQKSTRDKTIYQKPYQRDKYLGCSPRKIFGTILEVDQRRK